MTMDSIRASVEKIREVKRCLLWHDGQVGMAISSDSTTAFEAATAFFFGEIDSTESVATVIGGES